MAKLLIVEDDVYQRRLYAEEFADEGHQVVTAADAREALTKVSEEQPDLVILDIEMPGMDGVEALGKILDQNRRIPVILNTAYTSYKDNFMTWSADAYVVKSSDLTELKTQVRQLLEGRARN
jgi:DNA-binding response OmpR family regulator